MNKKDTLRLKEITGKISKNKKVVAIFLFGSQVTGKAREDSDIDIAVLIKDPSEKDESFIAQFWDDKLDIHSFHRLPLEIQFRVLRDGKILFIRNNKYVKYVWLKVIKSYLDFGPFISNFYRRVIQNA